MQYNLFSQFSNFFEHPTSSYWTRARKNFFHSLLLLATAIFTNITKELPSFTFFSLISISVFLSLSILKLKKKLSFFPELFYFAWRASRHAYQMGSKRPKCPYPAFAFLPSSMAARSPTLLPSLRRLAVIASPTVGECNDGQRDDDAMAARQR